MVNFFFSFFSCFSRYELRKQDTEITMRNSQIEIVSGGAIAMVLQRLNVVAVTESKVKELSSRFSLEWRGG
jgi:hypothetical protein